MWLLLVSIGNTSLVSQSKARKHAHARQSNAVITSKVVVLGLLILDLSANTSCPVKKMEVCVSFCVLMSLDVSCLEFMFRWYSVWGNNGQGVEFGTSSSRDQTGGWVGLDRLGSRTNSERYLMN